MGNGYRVPGAVSGYEGVILFNEASEMGMTMLLNSEIVDDSMNHDFKQLKVWEEAMSLTTQNHEVVKSFPSDERYVLCQQMRKSALSIASNIAERSGRSTVNEFNYFLSVAYASASELLTQYYLAHRLEYIDQGVMSRMEKLIDSIQRKIYRLQSHLKSKKEI